MVPDKEGLAGHLPQGRVLLDHCHARQAPFSISGTLLDVLRRGVQPAKDPSSGESLGGTCPGRADRTAVIRDVQDVVGVQLIS